MLRFLAVALGAIVLACAPTTTTHANANLRVADEHPQGYDRDQFKHWSDLDDDGADTRLELLADNFERYDVYYSRYDNEMWADPDEVDIDHTVALKEAWESGAWRWNDDKREVFANDPDNLAVMTDNLNRSKGSRDIAEWLPEFDECHFLDVWVDIKTKYRLTVDQREQVAIRDLTKICAPYSPKPKPKPTRDYDCDAFRYQEDAQEILERNPADPHHLDANNDGEACEQLPPKPEKKMKAEESGAVSTSSPPSANGPPAFITCDGPYVDVETTSLWELAEMPGLQIIAESGDDPHVQVDNGQTYQLTWWPDGRENPKTLVDTINCHNTAAPAVPFTAAPTHTVTASPSTSPPTTIDTRSNAQASVAFLVAMAALVASAGTVLAIRRHRRP